MHYKPFAPLLNLKPLLPYQDWSLNQKLDLIKSLICGILTPTYLVCRGSSLMSEWEPRVWGQQTWVWISLLPSMLGTAKWPDISVWGLTRKGTPKYKTALNRKASVWDQTKEYLYVRYGAIGLWDKECQWKTFPLSSVKDKLVCPGIPDCSPKQKFL